MPTIPFIFCAFANDKARYLKALPNEANDIDALFHDKKHLCDIKTLSNIRPHDLDRVIGIEYENIHIVHYGGHLLGNDTVLTNDTHGRNIFHANGFIGMLKGLPNLKLVFINGCESKQMVEELYDVGVPAVIGTTTKIDDILAFRLSVAFYQNIARQRSIAEAWQLAISLIIPEEGHNKTFRGASFKDSEINMASPSDSWFIRLHENAGDWRLDSDRVRNSLRVPNPIAIQTHSFPLLHNAKDFSLSHPTIGRDKDLATVCDMLAEQKQCIVVNGIGGIGKSTLVKYYIQQYKAQYQHIIWLQEKETAANILLDDSVFLTHLGIYEQVLAFKNANNEDAALELTLSKLNELPKQTLLIADNVRDLYGFETICNALSKDIFHILATSRKQTGNFRFHELDHLSLPDAKELFVSHCKQKTKRNPHTQKALLENPTVERILAIIHSHTLSIEIIAKIYNNSKTLSLESLERKLQEAVLNPKLPQTAYTHYTQKETTILATILAAFDIGGLLQQTEALEILAQWAVLPATPIPLEHLIALFGINIEDEGKFDKALTFLTDNAWIQQDKQSENSYACHALIQEAVRWQLDDRVRNFPKIPNPIISDGFNYDPLIKRLTSLLSNKAGDNPLEKDIWLPYSASVLSYLTAKTDILAVLSNNTAFIYEDIGNLPKSLEYGLKSMAIREKILSSEHPNLATSYNNIALTYKAMGDLPKSLEYGLKSLAIREKILSPEHPNLAISYGNIAGTYQAMGDFNKALEYRLKDLTIHEKILSPEHPYLATSYNNIAGTYNAMGDLPKSLEYGLKSMAIREKILSPEHPDLAASYNNIAETYRVMENLPNALEYGLKSMTILEKVLSSEHPTLATSYNNIALTYNAMGDLPKSLKYGLKSIAICKKILSPEHPDLAISYNNIASTYQAMGNLPKSLEYGLSSMAIMEKILSPEHPNLAASYNNIAFTYYYLQDYLQSLAYLQKAIQILRKSLPAGHANTKNAIGSMKVVLQAAVDAGQREEVEGYIAWYQSVKNA